MRPVALAVALLLSIPTGVAGITFSLPLIEGTVTVETDPILLQVQVGNHDVDAEIIRDQWGVPHIYADDVYSLFYANGYAQAQDRMMQMEILRHVGKGELASLTGGYGSLEMDLVTRRELYTHEERVATYESLDVLWRNAFDAFADGVNRWIAEIQADPTKMPAEYIALGELPEAWSSLDTLAIAEYLLDVFGRGAGGGEAQNAQMLAHLQDTLGDDTAAAGAFDDLVWGLRTDTYTTIAAGDGNPWSVLPQQVPHDLSDLTDLPPAQQEAFDAAQTADLDDITFSLSDAAAEAGLPFRMGSNAQTVGAEFAANGKPLLYGGPQMAYFTPMIPYELGLHGAGFDAVGMGIAGAPGVIIGRGPTHSWTVTSGSVDQVDTVVEKIVPGTTHTYYLDEANDITAEMDCRTETHVVKPAPNDFASLADGAVPPVDVVEQEICRTVRGPVLAWSEDGAYAFASYRSYRGDEARSGTLWLQIGQTRSIADVQELLDSFRFTFNFNLAESNADGDNIAYLHVGAQPVRHDDLDPRLPIPGWVPEYVWDPADALTGDDLPYVINPTKGYTVNWNNNPALGWHTGDVYEKWGSTQRAELMDQLLTDKIAATGNALTIDDLRQVHFDASTRDPYGDEFYDLMRNAAVASGDADAVAAVDEWAATGYFYGGYGDYLGTSLFGGAFADTMPDGMALFELWRSELQHAVFDDEIEPFVRELGWNPPETSDPHAGDHGREDNKHSILLDAMDGKSSHDWCDDITTPATETCQDIANQVMMDVLAIGDAWQDQPNRISKFAALGGGPAYEIPMTNRPSHQAFYDWGCIDGDAAGCSRNALPPGASGHLNGLDFMLMTAEQNGAPDTGFFPHLDDQLQMYVDFEDKPLLMFRADVEAFETSRVTLG
ncbi:MAG: penicillin acylase family protein [Thermoplasmatota archaeon]